jgi:hypothetical protein
MASREAAVMTNIKLARAIDLVADIQDLRFWEFVIRLEVGILSLGAAKRQGDASTTCSETYVRSTTRYRRWYGRYFDRRWRSFSVQSQSVFLSWSESFAAGCMGVYDDSGMLPS